MRQVANSPLIDQAGWSTGVSAVRSIVVRRFRLLVVLTSVLAVLVVMNMSEIFAPLHTGVVIEPAVAIALLVLARGHGLTWHDLGLSRRTWRKGLVYASIAVGAVAVVYLVAALCPLTQDAFLDARYRLQTSTALLTALVFIPLGTILLEEIAFRGVLLGFLGKHANMAIAIAVSSTLFGAWHILPSLSLDGNAFVSGIFGRGALATLIMIAATVVFTGLAGWLLCEVRRRSGSLLATAGLHWATNGLGVLLTSAMWTLRVGT